MPDAKQDTHLMALALDAALTLAATRPWSDIALQDIAREAEVSLNDFYGHIDKNTLVHELEAWADKAMSADTPEAGETPRERLFDVIMHRFEKMEAHRAGVLSMLKGRGASPDQIASRLAARRRTSKWALAAAGLDIGDTLTLAAQRLGLIQIISQTERAWRHDENGDFARTMATLDAELVTLEERLDQLKRLRKGRWARKPRTAEPSPPEGPQAETDPA